MAKILVIDDMEGIRQAITNTLENEGHTVSEASNGKEGQQAIEEEDFDLIITDMFMPEKDGFDIMTFARARNKTMPIIVISGGGVALTADWALTGAEAFASATIQKPFKSEVLIQTVNEQLAKADA
ncbi:MAG: response regulator [Pseudomonadota bacterium]|jgi:DNA-binding NtrC family response regulator|nr:response regulator [Alphaproteobacteria bacterium]MEC7701904.1 response regulator [Pseudomonadota bacterium]MEE3322461.1 response regulator [Pseudomonadota bacterium]